LPVDHNCNEKKTDFEASQMYHARSESEALILLYNTRKPYCTPNF